MDNITHSLFGAAVSESLWASLPEEKKRSFAPQTRKALFLTSVIGNNLPDLDFLYAPFMHANHQLGNLLHHRGHTHTVPIAILQSFLMLGLARLFFKKDLKWISWMAFLAPLTHILLDFLNNYGVHPFWPLDNTWKYGDWVFVLEPWAWATFAPFLFLLASTRKGKIFYAAVGVLGLALSWGLGVVPSLMCGVLTLWTFILLGILLRLKERGKVFITWTALATMLFAFDFGHRTTRKLLPQSTDLILSPLPVNPFCWAVVTAETNSTNLHLRRAIVAPFPTLVSLKTCTGLRFFFSEVPSSAVEASQILWETEHLVSLTELKALKDQFCDVRDFLRFSRAPYFWKDETGLYFSDLRFERANRKSFARIKIGPQAPPCPDSKAPWIVKTLLF